MYISRKELSINIDTKIYEYFFCMKQSNDLKSYCKKYNFDIRNIDKYLDIFPNIYSYLDEINDEFIKKELINKKDYLDNILVECDSNINLDEEQRVAILTDEDYDLIIAGAGAGKTTTVAGKVKYLVDQKNIDPKKILIVSFTNKEVNELRERINKQLHIDSPISTFHSIGRAITLKDETQIKQGIIDN